MASRLRTGILDLTQGKQARGAAPQNGRRKRGGSAVAGRELASGADLPDGAIENTFENRVKIARVLRVLRPRV